MKAVTDRSSSCGITREIVVSYYQWKTMKKKWIFQIFLLSRNLKNLSKKMLMMSQHVLKAHRPTFIHWQKLKLKLWSLTIHKDLCVFPKKSFYSNSIRSPHLWTTDLQAIRFSIFLWVLSRPSRKRSRRQALASLIEADSAPCMSDRRHRDNYNCQDVHISQASVQSQVETWH